jgi:hypothetical protein
VKADYRIFCGIRALSIELREVCLLLTKEKEKEGISLPFVARCEKGIVD